MARMSLAFLANRILRRPLNLIFSTHALYSSLILSVGKIYEGKDGIYLHS